MCKSVHSSPFFPTVFSHTRYLPHMAKFILMAVGGEWRSVILVLSSEAVARRCSVKKVFLEISQNSEENTCARVSFLIKLQARPATLLKKRLWHRCFPLKFATFLRTPFLTEHLQWPLLYHFIEDQPPTLKH